MFRRHAYIPDPRLDTIGAARLLADESEAFLAGSLVEQSAARRMPVPAWAWINRLAHGTGEELAELSRTSARRGADREWRQVRAQLAGELLIAAAAHGPLDRLQREVLVPIELETVRRSLFTPTPDQWYARVHRAIAADRDRQAAARAAEAGERNAGTGSGGPVRNAGADGTGPGAGGAGGADAGEGPAGWSA